MRWKKRKLRKVIVVVTGILLFLFLLLFIPTLKVNAYRNIEGAATPTPTTVQATPTIDPSIVAATAKEGLRKLERDNDRSFQAWFWNTGAALLSTLVLVGGGLLGFWQWRMNREDTRTKESQNRKEAQEKELKDRKAERDRRVEERFQSVVEGLGSEREESKVGAAIMLRTFLLPGYEEFEQFKKQTFDLAVAHLRLRKIDPVIAEPIDSLSQALIVIFKEAFPKVREIYEKEYLEEEYIYRRIRYDASRVQLDNAYLFRADLNEIRMLDAWLRMANLNSAQLYQAQLSRTKLNEARLVATYLRGANLSEAILIKAELRGADLSGANLKGANLEGADLSPDRSDEVKIINTNLEGANLSNTNIVDAKSLEDANLRGVIGLTKEQLEACKERGAIVDVATPANSTQPSISHSHPSQ